MKVLFNGTSDLLHIMQKKHYHMDKAYFIELPECQESDILLNHPLSAHQFF